MKYYKLQTVTDPCHSGEYNAAYRWKLPGIHCPQCHATWSGGSDSWPCVDLSGLAEHSKFEKARLEEDFSEYLRLCELVRPLLPHGAQLRPGTTFGPLVGTARGNFGPLVLQYSSILLIRREALEQLQAEGVRGLVACQTQLRFRQKSAPELLDLHVECRGVLHPDCLPPEREPPCTRCGRQELSLPSHLILATASLPDDRDLLRLADFPTVLVGTERFVEAVRRWGFEDMNFRELPLR